MGFLDKIKDLFSDEEEVIETKEIEVEEKEEHKLPTFMRNKIEEEQKREEEKKARNSSSGEVISDREIAMTRSSNSSNFSFPIEMDEPDTFEIPRYSNQNVLSQKREEEKKVSSLYSKKEEPKPKRFKPTPVISPVYGILDKNYTKEEVKEKKEDKRDIKRSSKKVDFETVRKKAFGNLVDDIKDNLMCENCELYKEVKKISSLKEDDLLYDLTLDTPPKEELTIEKCYDNYEDFGVSYEKEEVKITKEDIKNIVGSDEKEVNIINSNEIENVSEKILTKDLYENEEEKEDEPIALEKQEAKIEDDFFDLVDSMYKERDDE